MHVAKLFLFCAFFVLLKAGSAILPVRSGEAELVLKLFLSKLDAWQGGGCRRGCLVKGVGKSEKMGRIAARKPVGPLPLMIRKFKPCRSSV
jgi:hypothetical protein